jgi:hypothetical protein
MKIKRVITVLFFINIVSAQKLYFSKAVVFDLAVLTENISN